MDVATHLQYLQDLSGSEAEAEAEASEVPRGGHVLIS
jgi:hypothetical protein